MGRILGIIGAAIGLFITNNYYPDESFLFKLIPTVVLSGVGGGLGALIDEIYKKSKKKGESIKTETIQKNEIELSKAEVSATVEVTAEITDNTPVIFHYGFGGWLYVFTIGQIISSIMLINSFDDYYDLITHEDLATLRQNGYSDVADRFIGLGLLGILFMFVLISLTLISWYFALRRKKLYKNMSMIYIIVNGVGSLIIVGAMLYMNYYLDDQVYTGDDIQTPIIQSIVYSALWIPYFVKSKRVANTFTK